MIDLKYRTADGSNYVQDHKNKRYGSMMLTATAEYLVSEPWTRKHTLCQVGPREDASSGGMAGCWVVVR